MGTYYFNDRVKFELPWDFEYKIEYDESGEEIYHIRTGRFVDDDGEEQYKFSCIVGTMAKNPGDPITTLQGVFEKITEGKRNARRLFFDGKPEVAMFTYAMPMQIFGLTLPYYALIVPVLIGCDDVIIITLTDTYNDEEPQENRYIFEKMAQVISGMSVDGKSNNLRGMNGYQLYESLEPCFDEKDPIDVDSRIASFFERYSEDSEDTSAEDEFEEMNIAGFRKLSDIISIDDSGSNKVFCVNGQWQFTLPDDLSYEIDGEFKAVHGGISLTGTTKPLVLKEEWSSYGQKFCVAVEEHYSFSGDHMTVIDCKYDNRFGPDNGMNSCKVYVDEPDFYVDLISIDSWLFGVEATIRVRGDGVTPYNITMIVKPEGDDHWRHIAEYFKEIAGSVCRVQKREQRTKNSREMAKTVTDPNCIMSGTVLQRYIGYEKDVVLPEGITELADNIFSGRRDLRSIVIPEGVKTIGHRAFENCVNLERVTLPESLQSIGGYAFVDCHSLENINLGSSIEYIGGSAFSECYKLENVELPAGLKTIDAFVFKNCREFTKIVIPEGVTSIGFTAFASCRNLEYLYIPASVTGIHDNLLDQTPFEGCSKLTIYCTIGSYAAEYAQSHMLCWEYEERFSTPAKLDRETGIFDRSLTYDSEDMLLVGERTLLPIPDGYHASKRGSDANAGWAYIVPETTPLSDNHIDAKPYSFAVTVSPGAHLEFESKYLDALEKVFLSKGYLTEGFQVDSVVVSEKCGFLYQNWTDYTDATYNQIKGFLFADDAVYQFHIYANHDAEIAYEEKTIQNFLEVAKTWMQQVWVGDKPASEERADEKPNTKPTDPRQLTPDECEIDENGVFDGYRGPKAEIILPDTIRKVGRFCKLADTVKVVVIPDGVTVIEDYAFKDCKALESIVIPSTVTTIGESAFSGCSNLKEAVIPMGITAIGNNTFGNCTSLEKIHIPGSVTSIGDGSFSKCTSLKDILIPEGVTTIGGSAFYGCSGLETLVIPEGVRDIGQIAIAGCSNLTSIALPDSLRSIGYLAFGDPGKYTLHVYEDSYSHRYAERNKYNYVIREDIPNLSGGEASTPQQLCPEECEIDSDGVFMAYYGRKSHIILPDTVQKIGKRCEFSNAVESVTIPDGVTVIDEDAFFECSQLRCINLPDSIESIGESAFWGCYGLECINIPKGVTVLEKYTFYECSGLKSITIPGNVKTIESSAFGECSGLKTVTVSGCTTEVDSFAFKSCSSVKKVIISADSKIVPYWVCRFRESLEEVIIPNDVTHIEEEAFYECTKLKSIVLPEKLISIGRDAFCDCSNLEELVLPDTVTTIEESAFLGCSGIQSVNIPVGVSTIEEMVFCDCRSLTKIDIPDTVTSIKASAFQDCVELTSVMIPKSVTFIDISAFLGCYKLVDIVMPDSIIGLEKDIFEKQTSNPVQPQQEEWDIDENGVFRGYHGNAMEITLPERVTRIEGFEAPGVKKVIIPGTVETIAECAFFGCDHLEEIVVLDGVTAIEESAFAECTELKRIVLPNMLQIINDSTFESCESLMEIRIPAGVTELGNHVFNGCRNLVTVELPDSLTKIGAFAFNDCTNLKSLAVPESVLEIDEYAFSGCCELTSIKLPEEMTAIDESVFQDCSGLKEVILPEKITSIGSGAFCGCSELTEVIIPESVTSIGDGAFSRCEGLHAIKLPIRLRGSLGKDLFAYCEQLEEIVIPAGITEIAQNAFLGCAKLANIHLPPFIKEIHKWAFMSISDDAVFHVIKGSYPEHYCQEKGYLYDHNMDPELLIILQAIVRARKAQAEAKQRAEEEQKLQERRERYQKFVKAIEMQEQIISQNKGLFGSQAQARKEAQEKLARLQTQMRKEFPDGKP